MKVAEMRKEPRIKLNKRQGRPRKFGNRLSPRERLDLAKARAQERENELIAGRQIARDVVERASREEGAVVRSTLRNMSGAIAAKLVGVDEVEAKRILDEWADETLTAWDKWTREGEK